MAASRINVLGARHSSGASPSAPKNDRATGVARPQQ
jgi:hypothetical protein